jgi:iron complex transport system ATP-binding protein
MSEPVLATSGLSIGYKSRNNSRVISKSLNLRLMPGEMVCLLGPNGAGKSTLMRTIAGLQPLMEGEITVVGRNLEKISPSEIAQKLSLVLTERVEAGNLTVREVVILGRIPYTGWLGNLSSLDEEKIHWAMEVTETLAYQNHRINRLSDGERQKVMLARALAQDTPIILLDEPTAHLDLPSRVEMMRLLHQLARQMNKAILLSTHELDLALQAADKLWLMSQNGEFISGTPEDLVLNGSFEAVFAKAGFHFDKSSGTFTIHEKPVFFQVYLSGNPQLVFWTKRALRREGIGVDLDENNACKIAVNDEGKWILNLRENISEFTELEKLIIALRTISTQSRES